MHKRYFGPATQYRHLDHYLAGDTFSHTIPYTVCKESKSQNTYKNFREGVSELRLNNDFIIPLWHFFQFLTRLQYTFLRMPRQYTAVVSCAEYYSDHCINIWLRAWNLNVDGIIVYEMDHRTSLNGDSQHDSLHLVIIMTALFHLLPVTAIWRLTTTLTVSRPMTGTVAKPYETD